MLLRLAAVAAASTAALSSTAGFGIALGDGGVAENNEIRANGGVGILAGRGSLSSAVIANRAFDNGDAGISGDSEVLMSRNVASDNPVTQILGGRSLSDNLCTFTLC